MKNKSLVYIGFLTVFISSCTSKLHLVSWNMEHLAENVDEGCLPRQIEDYERMRIFAKELNADVVALQEVESVRAVARVFPDKDWNIIVSDRLASRSYDCRGNGQKSTQQRVALVIRKGVKYQKVGGFKELALDKDGLRYGLVAKIILGKQTLEVMCVHLKSGCFVDDYSTSTRRACKTFEQQAPILDGWVEAHIKEKRPFVLLGDFNHRIANPDNKLWKELTEIDGEPLVISNSMKELKGCHPRYPEPIDHILMGAGAEQWQLEGSQDIYYFPSKTGTMTEEEMFSDHCPIGVTLKF